jgi:TonB family protein
VLLAAAVALRTLWLVAGAATLRRIRRSARALDPLPDPIEHVQRRLETTAAFLVTGDSSVPMTYGVVRPVVFLPERVLSLDDPLVEAIASHELMHVRRRDWLEELLLESMLTLLWFHPAVWWLAGRIRLSREHVVDDDVIRLTSSRERYADALLQVSVTRRHTVLPAPAFHRKSLLKQRLAHILQETAMTTRRIVASLTAGAAVVAVAAVMVTRAFPLHAQAPAPAPTGEPVQIVKGGDHLLHGELPEYPARARQEHVEGDVTLDLFVDDRGEVSDARVTSGPDELRRAALGSVLTWHYSPSALSNISTQAVLRFHVPPDNSTSEAAMKQRRFVTREGMAVAFTPKEGPPQEPTPEQKIEHQIVELKAAIEDGQATEDQRAEMKARLADAMVFMEKVRAQEGSRREAMGDLRLVQVKAERVSLDVVSGLMQEAGLSVGSTLNEETVKRLRAAAKATDEHLRVEMSREENGGAVLVFIAR